jgi:branched-chain amino acid transport system ATP-binding protein
VTTAAESPAGQPVASARGGAVLDSALAGGDPIIEVEHVTLRFGGVTSLADVTLGQSRGEVLAVIGPNGAGKTSLFNCLTGVYVPQQGMITLHPAGAAAVPLLRRDRPGVVPGSSSSRPPRARKPNEINRLGVARTFQASRLFAALTAFENVKIGAESRQRTGPVGAMLHLPRTRREERESDRRASELLEFVGLRGYANELAASLPYGAQRRLEIARALATDPQLLLLDEPAAGTNPSEKVELAQLISRVNGERGVSVLLIEHDMRLVMSLAQRIVVLNFGAVIAAGTPAEVQRNPAVIEAYLGTAAGGTGEDGAGEDGAGERVATGHAGAAGDAAAATRPPPGEPTRPAPAGSPPVRRPGAGELLGDAAEAGEEGTISDPFVAAETWPIGFPEGEPQGSVPPEER